MTGTTRMTRTTGTTSCYDAHCGRPTGPMGVGLAGQTPGPLSPASQPPSAPIGAGWPDPTNV